MTHFIKLLLLSARFAGINEQHTESRCDIGTYNRCALLASLFGAFPFTTSAIVRIFQLIPATDGLCPVSSYVPALVVFREFSSLWGWEGCARGVSCSVDQPPGLGDSYLKE